ncbi:hypothetical protein [Microbacterium karelineae]|nr:hypothetical protein [Microbacterium karelineae]
MSKQDREAEVLALQKRALDPDDEYDGSDAMVRPDGDRGEAD